MKKAGDIILAARYAITDKTGRNRKPLRKISVGIPGRKPQESLSGFFHHYRTRKRDSGNNDQRGDARITRNRRRRRSPGRRGRTCG